MSESINSTIIYEYAKYNDAYYVNIAISQTN